ncbi:hypothetical protein SKAU_G00240630 [Synaphobranchus kaupii]|uniref:Uncharacterized protein n=1 Tax=Synaphobranchus kaupii TaxID=118154 RepID=A0A9Q1ITU9_SYNKA|nr:hypothetical protein SKAU_G00240630 [Synaphobranchus kaupii]
MWNVPAEPPGVASLLKYKETPERLSTEELRYSEGAIRHSSPELGRKDRAESHLGQWGVPPWQVCSPISTHYQPALPNKLPWPLGGKTYAH